MALNGARIPAAVLITALALTATSCSAFGGQDDQASVATEDFSGVPAGTRLIVISRPDRESNDSDDRFRNSDIHFVNADPQRSIRVQVKGQRWIASSVSDSTVSLLSKNDVHFFGQVYRTFPRPEGPEFHQAGAFELTKQGSEFIFSFGSPADNRHLGSFLIRTDSNGEVKDKTKLDDLLVYNTRCKDKAYVLSGSLSSFAPGPRQVSYIRADLTSVRGSGTGPQNVRSIQPFAIKAPCIEGKAYTLLTHAVDQSLTSRRDKFAYGLAVFEIEANKYEYKALKTPNGGEFTTATVSTTKRDAVSIHKGRLWFLNGQRVYSTKLDGSDTRENLSIELKDNEQSITGLTKGLLYVVRQQAQPSSGPAKLDVYDLEKGTKIEEGTTLSTVTGPIVSLSEIVVME